MKIAADQLANKFIWVLTVSLFVCFLVFDTYTWGKYYLLAAAVLVLLISTITDRGIIRFKMGAYQWLFLAFTVYVFLSALWAMSSSDSVIMAQTLFRILICSTFIYIHYVKQDNVHSLLRAIIWAGYVVAIYSIIFYGIYNIYMAGQAASMRLDNEYTNINSIGLACALACVLQFAELLYSKKYCWTALLMIPAVVVIAATQSRKAIVFVICGMLLLVIFKNLDSKNFLKNMFKIAFSLGIVIIVFCLLSKIDIFAGISERLESMLNHLTGAGKADHSTIVRNEMVVLGIEWWKKNPIIGIGIANPHIISAQYLHFDAYLHNNFVELLCGGGMIGFILYYSMYAYLLINLWKYRCIDKKYVSVCFVWLILMLAMDYGMVSYYSKSQCFYLMIQFVNIQCLKRKAAAYEHQQVA